MADKLEERLRDAVVMEHSGLIGERDKLDETSLGPEAADEITRLNAENEELRLHCANYEATMRVIGETSEGAELARLNALVDEMLEGPVSVLAAFGAPDSWDDRRRSFGSATVKQVRHARALITKAQPPVSHD